MASAAKTPNLGLPQWVAGEKPERTDFNAAFLAIDGAVVKESGSKANGKYVKFADGTMQQYGSIATTAIINGITSIAITFPVSFYDTDYSPNGIGGPSVSWAGVYVQGFGLPAVTGFTLVVHSDSAQNFVAGKWSVIGRWKA